MMVLPFTYLLEPVESLVLLSSVAGTGISGRIRGRPFAIASLSFMPANPTAERASPQFARLDCT